jgi:hypothetical protein
MIDIYSGQEDTLVAIEKQRQNAIGFFPGTFVTPVLLLDSIAQGVGEILRDLGLATAEREKQPDPFR